MITGTQNPMVGKEEFYGFSDPLDIFNVTNATFVWNIWKKNKSGSWINITKKPEKTGQKVSFKFGEKVIGIEFKLQVYKATKKLLSNGFEAKLAAEILVIPRSAKTPRIDKVVLFNQGAKDPNKASYKDSLIARAHCVAMFNQEVEFRLWEDDATGGGHHETINKNNQLPQVFKAKVNEKGIAEVKISLLSNEKVLKAIANKYMMSGDKSEGANHEFYVTASYNGKIQNASQVNVDVTNSTKQPKKDSAIFSGTSTQPEKLDKEKKVTHAYFINSTGNSTNHIKVGDSVRIRIKTNNMIGEYIQYIVWEKDRVKSDDIFRSQKMKIIGNSIDTSPIIITREKFNEGIDANFPGSGDPDKDQQQYFIEIIPLSSHAKSVSFGIDDEVKSTKVDSGVSPAVVNGKKPAENEKDPCFCNRDFKEEDVKKFVKLLKGSETIWEGVTLKGGKKIECNISDKSFATLTKFLNISFKKYQINTCAQKMHFLAQVTEETGTFALPEEITGAALSSQSIYKGRGLLQLTGVKKEGEDLYNGAGPYKDFADYRGDQNIVKNPSIVANNVDYCIDSGAWIWSVNKKMPSNKKSQAVIKWGEETAGKSLNELAVYVDKYLELISVLLNGRNSDTGMPNGWAKRKSNYELLKTVFFMYQRYHENNNKPVNAKDLVTYHIYASGEIEKHVPKAIKAGFANKYRYIYHDKNNKEHDVCTVDKHTAQNWIKGSKEDGGKGWEKRTAGKTRYYLKGEGKVELIKVPVPINYHQDGVVIKIGDNTDRIFINPKAFASMLGAVAECGYTDFNFNGSTSEDGTGAPSVTHVNGISFDFRYLRKDKSGDNLYINTHPNDLDVNREEKFIDALIKFGYSKFYSVNITINKKSFILKNSSPMADHHHHLHIRKEGYNPNFKEIKAKS